MLFRSCNTRASLQAKLLYTQWGETNSIPHPLTGVPIGVNVFGCHSELWKMVACSLHVQPCHPMTHTTLLCRLAISVFNPNTHSIHCATFSHLLSTILNLLVPCVTVSHREDCLMLMGDCMTLGGSMTAQEVCEDLSPSYLQGSCISLRDFLSEWRTLLFLLHHSLMCPPPPPPPPPSYSTFTIHQTTIISIRSLLPL